MFILTSSWIKYVFLVGLCFDSYTISPSMFAVKLVQHTNKKKIVSLSFTMSHCRSIYFSCSFWYITSDVKMIEPFKMARSSSVFCCRSILSIPMPFESKDPMKATKKKSISNFSPNKTFCKHEPCLSTARCNCCYISSIFFVSLVFEENFHYDGLLLFHVALMWSLNFHFFFFVIVSLFLSFIGSCFTFVDNSMGDSLHIVNIIDLL